MEKYKAWSAIIKLLHISRFELKDVLNTIWSIGIQAEWIQSIFPTGMQLCSIKLVIKNI